MAVNNKSLTNIDFDNEWKYYCQTSNDRTDDETIISAANNSISYHQWSSVKLPHIIDVTNSSCKWWYCKQFDWVLSTNQLSEQQINLNFESLNNHKTNSDINAIIWLNNTQIFSGLLTKFKIPIELHHRNKQNNILIICCMNTSLSLYPSLFVHERTTICTTNDNLLVPRLTIVILIVGTRGDVQPFVALGQALQAVGHRVRLATHETFRTFVRSNGLEFYPLGGDPADLMTFMVKNAGIIPSISSIADGDIGKKRRSVAEILASTWQACIANDDETNVPFTAQAIIANPPSFGHIHCAEKLQIPLHIMFTMPWSPTIEFSHPLSNIDSSKNESKRKINLYSYDAIEMLTWTGMGGVINKFRQSLGLRELYARQATNALIDECVPHTYCWSPSLVAKPKDWANHINVSGFFFLNLSATFTSPPQDLLDFLGINQSGDCTDRTLSPPIYIGFGSITGHDSRRILKIVLDAINQTGYRVLLSGLATDTDQLPSNIFKIGNVPHDWLFQYVSAVCHHGGAGTTAAGLRAGKPTIIVPFFGDQFFWGNVIEKNGAGPRSLPGKSMTVCQLVEAFHFVHQPTTRAAAERIRDHILNENGCAAAVHAFHANLPLKRMHSDLESTFAACYRLNKYNIQISRSVAQVLVTANVLKESELSYHVTREWEFMYDHRRHLLTHGIIEHLQKFFSTIFIDIPAGLIRAAQSKCIIMGILKGIACIIKGLLVGAGHLLIGCLSLYGELSDTLELFTILYDPYSDPRRQQRPHVTSFKSGVKAAFVTLWNGWTDGITGIVTRPRTGYRRHGLLGAVAGILIGIVNIGVKPAVGTFATLTWLSRGVYISIRKRVQNSKNRKIRIPTKLFDTTSNEDIRSGFHPDECQRIIQEFEQIKNERGLKNILMKKLRNLRNLFSKRK